MYNAVVMLDGGGIGSRQFGRWGYNTGDRTSVQRRSGTDMMQPVMARIYRSGGNVMQSGRARNKHWVLEFEPVRPGEVEPLMGWTASADPLQQVRMVFPDRNSAIAHAERQGWSYTVSQPREPPIRPKSYASNFLEPK